MDAIGLLEDHSHRGYDPCKFSVLVDTGTIDGQRLILFESWLTLWCKRNCVGLWDVSQDSSNPKDYQLVLKFSNPREAVHFKLVSPSMHVKESVAIH